MRNRLTAFLIIGIGAFGIAAEPEKPDDPTAQSILERRRKENAPVWTDGDTATFFFQGDADQVTLMFSGERFPFRRIADSDVWIATVAKPGLAKSVFTYVIVPAAKGETQPKSGQRLPPMQRWRGPEAPPAPARAEKLAGEIKSVDFDSKALGGIRKVRVYLPPGHDRAKRYPVIYSTDGNDSASVLEPLITSGKMAPLIVVAATSGDYLGDRSKGYDPTKDLRSMEYLTGEDAERYSKHEKFFCDELRAWAETEFGASGSPADRAIFGCSNGARFAVDMGVRHPDLYGHVIAFSVAGRRDFQLPETAKDLPQFHLAAGTWEVFLKTTSNVAAALEKHKAQCKFVTRIAGHDFTMWEDELAAAAQRAFPKNP